MLRSQTVRPVMFATVLVATVAASAGAQLASRPAEDWARVLDNPERLASLKVDEVVASLRLQPGQVVADLGAGTGPFIVPFARAVTAAGKVYAVDIDEGFFPHIRSRAADAGVTNVQTVLGAFTDPKLPAADLDVAFFHDVLHHIEDPAGYLKNLVRYVKPDGRIVVIDYHPAQSPHRNDPSLQVSRAQTDAWLAASGFGLVEEIAVFDDKWFAVYRR
jgi:ubiquinone/menaquinone biosynthesis C-methylase UbiE